MRASTPLLVLCTVFVALTSGCAPIVGDACETSTDCGRTMFCELSMPGGYCTVEDCDSRDCPGDGVCIRFSEDVSWCMQPCDGNGDCRDGYTCVKDFGPHAFCNDARGTAPSQE